MALESLEALTKLKITQNCIRVNLVWYVFIVAKTYIIYYIQHFTTDYLWCDVKPFQSYEVKCFQHGMCFQIQHSE